MEHYVNEARAEAGWWDRLEKAYRHSYMPTVEQVADRLEISAKTLRKQYHEHGIKDWRELHGRFS